MMEASILHGLLAFMLFVVGVALALRALRRSEPALIVMSLGLGIFLLAIPSLLFAGRSINLWAFTVSYWFFTVSFLMIFGALYKSISLRILRDLLEKPDRFERYNTILARYVAEESYQSRLEVIRERRLAVQTGNRYALTARGQHIARWVRTMQNLFGIKRSG